MTPLLLGEAPLEDLWTEVAALRHVAVDDYRCRGGTGRPSPIVLPASAVAVFASAAGASASAASVLAFGRARCVDTTDLSALVAAARSPARDPSVPADIAFAADVVRAMSSAARVARREDCVPPVPSAGPSALALTVGPRVDGCNRSTSYTGYESCGRHSSLYHNIGRLQYLIRTNCPVRGSYFGTR